MAMSLMISGERIGRSVRRAAASVEQPEVYRVGSRQGPEDGGLGGEGWGGDHWGDDVTVRGCLVDGAAGGTKRADGSAAMVSWRPGDGNHCSRAQRPARSHARLYSSPSRACPLAHVLATISHVCTLARVLPRMCTPSRACFPLHACGRRQAAYAPNASACLKPPPDYMQPTRPMRWSVWSLYNTQRTSEPRVVSGGPPTAPLYRVLEAPFEGGLCGADRNAPRPVLEFSGPSLAPIPPLSMGCKQGTRVAKLSSL